MFLLFIFICFYSTIGKNTKEKADFLMKVLYTMGIKILGIIANRKPEGAIEAVSSVQLCKCYILYYYK